MKYYKAIGPSCPYCGTQTEDACCGEMHHEIGYVEVDKDGAECGSTVLFESEICWVESTLLK